MSDNNPEYLLFAQHGWADTGSCLGKLVSTAADSRTEVIAPSLGLVKTFVRLDPLVERLAEIVRQTIAVYPQTPIKLVGHSMGGLLWLELLERNPQWRAKIHSFILLGSPVGGSNVARIIDPLGWGIGTAADLGKNRRSLAEKIARQIPTLSVASDLGNGTDGLVTVENTKFDYANWLAISGITHNAMRYHPDMMPIMQRFWANPTLGSPPAATLGSQLIRRLRTVTGMTDADYRDLDRARVISALPEDLALRTWQNPWGTNHVYLTQQQQYLYAGYVGLLHARNLHREIDRIREDLD